MLQNKDIAKIQEIKTFFTKRWTQVEFFSKQLDLFHFSKTSKIFSFIKQSGVPAWDVLKLLFVLPFTNCSNIHSLYTSKMTPKVEGQKDTYYRMLSNQKINWRSLLFLFVKRYLKLDEKFTQPTDNTKCLIFDDTELKKTGKSIEGVSKIHSHVSKTFFLGYKLLVAGYWNGAVFIPVDFSFHRESKNNKKYGLSKKEYKNQKKTKRAKGMPVLARFKELNYTKNEMIIKMFKRIHQRKIKVNYILIDSWFTSIDIINKFQAVNKTTHIIGMYKYNSKVNINDKISSIKQLRKSKKGLKRSRKTGYYYMSFIGKIDDCSVKIFLSRKGKRGNWHTLITTDTSLSYNNMMKLYSIRWSIEIFFKETKQLLGLGKSQSTNFDVQVAQMTITMIQYLLISLKYRMEAYETINGLFKDVKQDYIEHKLNERIMAVIVEFLAVLEILGVTFDYEELISKILSYSENLTFLKSLEYPIKSHKLVA